jgi:hypothetical protein
MGDGTLISRAVTRRRFLGGAASLGALAALGAQCEPALVRRLQQEKHGIYRQHVVWVWQFTNDGTPAQIASNLRANRLGITLKTHDGVHWMSRYDRSPQAISGPSQIRTMANFFEQNGVPFHAWCVVKGVDPIREARMAAEVLEAGARSLILDLEGHAGFWVGTRTDAVRYGDELRRRNPFGRVDISIDARPWWLHSVPLPEFVWYTDAIWPQLYWDTFDNGANIEGYRRAGYHAGSQDMTPEFLLDTTAVLLSNYNRPIVPIGQGASNDIVKWQRFIYRAWQLEMPMSSVWRYGVTPSSTLSYLGQNPAGQRPRAPQIPQPTATSAVPQIPSTQNSPTATRTPLPVWTPVIEPTNTPVPTNTPLP